MEFHDLGAQYRALKSEIDEGIAQVLNTGAFILGPQVDQLERALAADVGRPHCITCASGTDALVLALMMWRIRTDETVFVPDFTYFATASCVSTVNALVEPVDIDPDTFNLCPDALEAAIMRVLKKGGRPRAVIAVDLFGQPANYQRICVIARRYGLLVLEDAAQGYGGKISRYNACSFGDAAVTSFFPAKPLGCYGDGGAIFVNDPAQDETLRSLRANGRSPLDKYDNRIIGMNSRLDTLQAAVLLPKLKALRAYELQALNQTAALYTQLLAGVVKTPVVPAGYTSSWAQYSILLESAARREQVQAALRQHGIPSMIYYPRGVHQQTAYKYRLFPDELYPNTISVCSRILSLPMHPYMTPEDVHRVCDVIKTSAR